MRYKSVILCGMLITSVFASSAKDLGNKAPVGASQEFKVMVYENTDSTLLTFGKNVNSRGLLGDMWKSVLGAYRSTALGTVSTLSADLLSSGIGMVVEAMRDKKGDWMAQVNKDCRYTKKLPMQQQITDFYANTSTRGAMDLDSIVFDGFGCQQYLNFKNPETGEPQKFLVFDLKCTLRKDEEGKNRMLHHSKFEVEVDHLFFNPYLCNLPNDSLTEQNANLRTPFSFDSRKNLSFSVDAKITSSWMNEAIQVVNDQLLGEFNITATVPNDEYIQNGDWYPGYFVYIRPTKENIATYALDPEQIKEMERNGKRITVKGESFLVPRSFIGYDGTSKPRRIWGTGQYKVDMAITESCDINYDYYLIPEPGNVTVAMAGPGANLKGRKWNKYWTEEWNRMKRRRGYKNIFQSMLGTLNMTYGNNRWVYTLLDPVATVILTQENAFLADRTQEWLKLGKAASSGTPAAVQTQSQPKKK